MAKKKKTMEELLEEALVPEEEQPYEVPGNWVWTRIGNIFTQVKEQIKPNGTESYIGLEQLLKGGGITESASSKGIKSNKVVFKKNDVLYGKLRPYLNKHAIVNFDGVASTDILVYRSNSKFRNLLLNYYLGLPMVVSYANENSNGINLPRVSPMTMNLLPFPLPPLNEQKRIADKVERLLNKIDEAKRLIEEAKESFELRRAAILDKAFRGELTKEWRELRELPQVESKQDGPYKLPQGWIWKKIGDLFHVQIGSTPSRKNDEYWGGAFSWLSSGEIQFNIINDSRDYVTEKAINECRLKLAPKGSILFGMIGEGKTRGQVAILDIDSYHNQNTASIWVSETEIDSEYVYYWLLSQYTKNRQNSAGNNQPAYNKSRVKELFIPLPPLAEIKVMIHIIKGLMQKEIKVNELLELNITMDSIKQSILSKAFKGQLGTNDPTEENAIELLKEVLQEKL
ncbi:restriction endonuclease subunit S [Shouchella clausii]|uniref:restriction endonuclease subunit S n=2 Tax=Shouchella clausii TaxID=79880 RepID=UPI003982E3EB